MAKPRKPRKPSYWDDRTKALMWLAGPNGLHPDLVRVLTRLIAADNKGHKVAWHSQTTMAKDTYLGERTIRRAIAIWQVLGAIGIVYRTREDALAAGIPVHDYGNPIMNVAKVYYDWEGFHSKLFTPELVTAIIAAMEDRACLLTPWVWYKAASKSRKKAIRLTRNGAKATRDDLEWPD